MPRRRRGSKRRGVELTDGQWWELVLGPHGTPGRTPGFGCFAGCRHPFGPHLDGCPSHFASEDERFEAFKANADWLCEPDGGTRSWAWWRYVARERRPHYKEEARRLEELGELEPWERVLLRPVRVDGSLGTLDDDEEEALT